MERIRADIRLLDRAPHQLVIEASVIETTQDALGSLGVDWATKWLAGQHSDTSAPNLVYSTVARTQIAALTALVQTGRANLRANPRITTADGQTAEIEVGRDAYFAIVSGPAAYSYTTLEKIRASILLRITPRVLMPEREIIARIEPDIGDVTGKGMNGLPEITFRRALTSLRVRDGQSIVIGGLTNEVETRTVTKFPILGDIPLLGFAFRKQASRKTRTEVVIVITPRILYEGAE